ncbi:PPE family protein [Mycobacterium tuberculosis]|nr:PPE family protein [Mycobacterium tuberculosis]
MPNTPEMADVAAGNRGLDALGFAGTIPKSAPGSATGLTHLGGGFADVLSQPMLPHTWDGQIKR